MTFWKLRLLRNSCVMSCYKKTSEKTSEINRQLDPMVPPPPPVPFSYWPTGQANFGVHASREGVHPERQVSGALGSPTLPLGGGSQIRDLSVETRQPVPTPALDDRP